MLNCLRYFYAYKEKRVGFIPRDDVIKIINKLSFENNLSGSKIISILVEEALENRGLFKFLLKENQINPYNARNESQSSTVLKQDKSVVREELKESRTLSNDTSSKNNNDDIFDVHTYEKFLSFLRFRDMIKNYES